MAARTVTVLLVEDNPPDVRYFQAIISRSTSTSFEVKHVPRLQQALQVVDQGGIDVVLLDLGLPDSTGIETLGRMVARTSTPVVVLTGLDDERLGIAALEAGAQDYLVKGQVDTGLLVRAIRYAIKRKELFEELSTSHAQQHVILEQNRDGIIIVDDSNTVLYINPAAKQLLGLSSDDVPGQVIGLPIGDRKFKEMEITHSGSEVVTVEKRVAEIQWEGAPAYLASLRDVTERKQHEETRRMLAAKNLVLDEVNHLTEMKSQFIEVVTHEMRTPMTAVLASVGLLMEGSLGGLNEGQNKFLQMISRNIDRLARFTTEVLSLSRLDAGKYTLNPRETSLRTVLTPVVQLLETTAREKKVDLRLQREARDDVRVFADADAVSQVVTNLVSNAVAHCPPGTQIELSWRELPSGLAEVTVEDTGQGIPADQLEQIFDRFHQVNRRRGPGYRGTGIGLSICKGLVESMGGRISVSSTVGHGTAFRFTLPCMGDCDEILFGKLALKLGYVTAKQLQRVVDIQDSAIGPQKLGELLRERQVMSGDDVEHVLHCQQVLLSRPHPWRPANLGESLLGRMVVKYGYLTEDQLNCCLRIQELRRTSGKEVRLGQILVEQGHMTEVDILLLLRMQHQDIAGCPACERKYNTMRRAPQTINCPACGALLEIQKHPESIRVYGDVA